jgi:acetylornithine aminotransferase
VRFPDEEFVKSLVQKAINNHCLIIADEVTTGLGRLGTWFGFEHYQVKPDMVVCGKALGNGYPVSSVTLNSNCSDLFNKNIFRYAQSHQNDPLGCAVALAVLKVFNEEQVLENCKIMGNYFLNRLHDIQSKYPDKIKEVRARGLMLAVEFHELFNGEIFQQKLFERGFVFGFKLNTLRFLPPLVIGEKEIDSLGNSIVEILEE